MLSYPISIICMPILIGEHIHTYVSEIKCKTCRSWLCMLGYTAWKLYALCMHKLAEEHIHKEVLKVRAGGVWKYWLWLLKVSYLLGTLMCVNYAHTEAISLFPVATILWYSSSVTCTTCTGHYASDLLARDNVLCNSAVMSQHSNHSNQKWATILSTL